LVVSIVSVKGTQQENAYSHSPKSKLVIKFLNGTSSTKETFTFDNNTREVKIGRMSDCDIKIKNDTGLSRIQCV
jgi:hypothetical protein